MKRVTNLEITRVDFLEFLQSKECTKLLFEFLLKKKLLFEDEKITAVNLKPNELPSVFSIDFCRVERKSNEVSSGDGGDPIETLTVSGNIQRLLKRAGIKTVTDLTARTRQRLRNMDIGPQMLARIEKALEAKGLCLSTKEEDVTVIPQFEINLEEITDPEKNKIAKLLLTQVEDLELSVRAFNCLKAAKINNLSHLVQYSVEELMKFRNFGNKSISELEQVLHERGLTFGMNLTTFF